MTQDTSLLLGLTLEEALNAIPNDAEFLVDKIDGKPRAHSMILRQNCYHFEIENGAVSKCTYEE